MTGPDRLQEAVAELYSSDPDKFIERRKALVAKARAAREDAAASRIAALRKPTRSAWMINQLARSDPGATAQLVQLGDELSAAQRALDGARIRALSVQRRDLIDALTRQVFSICAEQAPSAALRDEIVATLSAALADPRIAERVQHGTLQRAAHSEGFGPMAPVLTVVPPPAESPAAERHPPDRAAGTGRSRGGPARRGPAGPAAERRAGGRAGAQPDRRRTAIAGAEKALDEAHRAVDVAVAAEEKCRATVERITEQLAEARSGFNAARLQVRQAEADQRQARLALERLRRQGGGPDSPSIWPPRRK